MSQIFQLVIQKKIRFPLFDIGRRSRETRDFFCAFTCHTSGSDVQFFTFLGWLLLIRRSNFAQMLWVVIRKNLHSPLFDIVRRCRENGEKRPWSKTFGPNTFFSDFSTNIYKRYQKGESAIFSSCHLQRLCEFQRLLENSVKKTPRRNLRVLPDVRNWLAFTS